MGANLKYESILSNSSYLALVFAATRLEGDWAEPRFFPVPFAGLLTVDTLITVGL